jgi:hypothetical protein
LLRAAVAQSATLIPALSPRTAASSLVALASAASSASRPLERKEAQGTIGRKPDAGRFRRHLYLVD